MSMLPGPRSRQVSSFGYYNSIQPHAKLYDGFLVSIGGGRPRLDEKTKFFKVITETEVGRGQATVRAPDTETTHTWEITGSAHMASDLMSMDKTNFRTVLGGILDRDIGVRVPVSQRQCVRPHPSDVEAWVVHSASYAALDRWVTENVPPSAAERINVSAAPTTPPGAPTIIRDDKGFAVGGIRLPRVAVPTALNTGENLPANTTLPENNFCYLYGTHIPFDAATLRTLYQTREAYLREVKRVVEELVKKGFVSRARRADAHSQRRDRRLREITNLGGTQMADMKEVSPWTWQDQFGFSQAISVEGAQRLLFCAGQTSVDADGEPLHPGDFAKQMLQAIDNLETVLAKAGMRLSQVARLNYYVTDVEQFLAAAPVFGPRLQAAGCKPAATLLKVSGLFHPDIVLEIEATAVE